MKLNFANKKAIPVSLISARAFLPYGKIIGYPNQHKKRNKRNLWRVVHQVKEKRGWRIAYLIVRDRHIRRLEIHPYSDESFEPTEGKAILFVAKRKSISAIKAFLLDKPIILRRGVWHGIITLTAQTEVKITENVIVKCRYWHLGGALQYG